MSHREIYDALIADQDKLQIRVKTVLPKIVKAFMKERKYPSWKWVEYTHQGSKNKYLLSFYAASVRQADNPKVNVAAFMEEDRQRIVIRWGYWPYRRFGSIESSMVRSISLFCPHFFHRYRERVWNNSDMPFNELVCRYMSRNQSAIPLKLTEDIQRNHEQYSEFSYAYQQKDGICFVEHGLDGDELTIGTPDDNTLNVNLFYTIVTSTMMSDLQKKAIDKRGREYIRNYYKSLLEDAMNDVIFRTLNATIKARKHDEDD